MNVEWGQQPSVWVYGTKMRAYDWLRIRVPDLGEDAGLVAEAASVRHCADDLENARQVLGPDVKAIVVQSSHLPESARGTGLGLAMYRLAAREAASRGYVLAPNECWHGGPGFGMTSRDAQRVWSRLRREFPSFGNVIWGGEMPRTANPDHEQLKRRLMR